jgi:hypothetical protein
MENFCIPRILKPGNLMVPTIQLVTKKGLTLSLETISHIVSNEPLEGCCYLPISFVLTTALTNFKNFALSGISTRDFWVSGQQCYYMEHLRGYLSKDT